MAAACAFHAERWRAPRRSARAGAAPSALRRVGPDGRLEPTRARGAFRCLRPRLSPPRSPRSWPLLLGAGSASAATDHVVITGGAVVPPGQTAGDVVVLDGTVRIAGRATGDVVSVAGPVRVTGRADGDLIAVSDRAVPRSDGARWRRPALRRRVPRCSRAARGWAARSAMRTGPTQRTGGAGWAAGSRGGWRCPFRR